MPSVGECEQLSLLRDMVVGGVYNNPTGSFHPKELKAASAFR
jgi:hypothetical protein